MPSNSTHIEHSFAEIGISAGDLHAWMDQPAQWLGEKHRELRHCINEAPEWAIEKYGIETTESIMRCHIDLDFNSKSNEKGKRGGRR